MTFAVRQVSPEDWRDWRLMRQRSLSEDPSAFSSSTTMWAGPNDTEERWRARLADGACFIAYEDGAPVGMVAGMSGEDGNQLISMWVAPGVRRRGIGAALINAVIGWNEGQPLRLRVIDGNTSAISAYVRDGFAMLEGSTDDEGCRTMVWYQARREALR